MMVYTVGPCGRGGMIVCWEEDDPDFLLLDRLFGCLLDMRPLRGTMSVEFHVPEDGGPYERCNVGELFIGSDKNRLHKELVTTLCIRRRILLHGL